MQAAAEHSARTTPQPSRPGSYQDLHSLMSMSPTRPSSFQATRSLSGGCNLCDGDGLPPNLSVLCCCSWEQSRLVLTCR